MNRRGRGKTQANVFPKLTPYLTRSRTVNQDLEESAHVEPSSPARGKMATASEVQLMLATLKDSLSEEICQSTTKLNDSLVKTNETIDSFSMKLDALNKEMKTIDIGVKKNRDAVERVESSLLASQVHDRKYNLLLYNMPGIENVSTDTIKVVREFTREKLQLPELAESMLIRHAHRLPRNAKDVRTGPLPIIVVFLIWDELCQFREGARNIPKEDRISIRTDLPPVLRKLRNDLVKTAYNLRTSHKLQTRIREKGIEVWLETRRGVGDPWKKYHVTKSNEEAD